jgi:phospholipid transport system substrate-binding protein
MFRILISLMLLTAAQVWAAPSPTEVVTSATNNLITDLNKLSIEERTDDEVRRLVMSYIVPVIDQEKIASGALGKYWSKTSPEQRQQFIERFRELQIRTYSGAFKAFSGEKLEFEDARVNDEGDKALVKGQLVQTSGNIIPIDFRLFKDSTTREWRIYDAVVSGLSMVKTYREQMAERLQGTNQSNVNERINQLLDELAKEAEQVSAAATVTAS